MNASDLSSLDRPARLTALLFACSAMGAHGAFMTFTSPGYSPGGAVTQLTGSLAAGAPTWTRPSGLGQFRTPTLATSAGREYQTRTFTPTVTASYEATQSGTLTGRQTYLYAGTFNPNVPLQNLLIGITTTGNFGTPVLQAGQTYTFVTTNQNAGSLGSYTLNLRQGATSDAIGQIPNGSPTGRTFDIVLADPGIIGSFQSVQLLGVRGAAAGDFLVTLTHVESGRTIDLMDRLTGDVLGSPDYSIGNMLGNFSSADYTFVDAGGAAWPASATSNVTPGTYNRHIGTPGFAASAADGALADFVGTPLAGTWRLTVADLDGNPASDWSSVAGFRFTADIVPEPTVAASALGALAFVLHRRRRS